MSGQREAGPHPMRLFFALWPGARHRQGLFAATRGTVARVDGNPVPPGNLHVTLAFLGNVPGRTFVHLVEVGGQGGYPQVALDFDCLAYWAKPRVVVALAPRTPPEGLAVVDRLWQRVEALGFAHEQRPWQPHLTLVRQVRAPPTDLELQAELLPQAADPDAWSLALVESTSHPTGVRYRPLAEWRLG